jgi:hypothetical protein
MKVFSQTGNDSDKEEDLLPAMIRAYVPAIAPAWTASAKPGAKPNEYQSDWVLIFDTETDTTSAQSLRFGTYQLRQAGKLFDSGIFYDPQGVSKGELKLLQEIAISRGCTLLTRDQFVDDIFFKQAYEFRATFVGFNLPFDISRIAISHNSARGKTMKGGFTFKLSKDHWSPRIQVRHLNSRVSLIQFSEKRKKQFPRAMRKKKVANPPRRGSFIDVKTIAAALVSRSFNLASLAEFLGTDAQKGVTSEHGRELTTAYVEYALQDTQTTWECYLRLCEKFESHGLKTPLSKILSEAGLGKAYLREMKIRSHRTVQPDFPDSIIGQTMNSYYGGRSEVRWRRVIKQSFYCDFLSMYPTVCTLMGLWKFVIANGMDWKDTTIETQKFLDEIQLQDLQSKETFKHLSTLVRLKPNQDVLPVRAKYSESSATIGINVVQSDFALWYTLADVIASKLIKGAAPFIDEAMTFIPREPQSGLQSIRINNDPNYLINPLEGDFYKSVIDMRSAVKARMENATERQKDDLNSQQQTAKILANATSYGIFVEIIVSELEKIETRFCFGPSGVAFPISTIKSEEPGPFFHPLLATLITGAARLMLAMAERLAMDAGIDWAYCDTDSMTFAKPDCMSSQLFMDKASNICEWFSPLNPYDVPGPLFKIEKVNYVGEALAPLFCLCVSSKRYVLFNLAADGTPIIRKASSHGLGHLRGPYQPEEAPPDIPAPIDLTEIGVERWHYDLWYQIIMATIDGHPDEVDLSKLPHLGRVAIGGYNATTPDLLSWFKIHNSGLKYREQVKPFGFLNCFTHFGERPQEIAGTKRGRPKKLVPPKPIAPFCKDVLEASLHVFDRETGKAIGAGQLKTYSQAVAQHHLHPELKFLNGDYIDQGRTERRRVRVTTLQMIGKEANNWEQQFHMGSSADEQIIYGTEPETVARLRRELPLAVAATGARKLSRSSGVPRAVISRMLKTDYLPKYNLIKALLDTLDRLPADQAISPQVEQLP